MISWPRMVVAVGQVVKSMEPLYCWWWRRVVMKVVEVVVRMGVWWGLMVLEEEGKGEVSEGREVGDVELLG